PGDDSVLFSIVTPVFNTATDVLRETVESVVAQTYGGWELILVDDCSTHEAVLPQLRAFAQADPRVKVVERAENGHIVAASNDGVRAARGQFLVLLDHDDLLTPDALERNLAAIEHFDDVDYLYSDEDKVGVDGEYFDVFRKPAWSPQRLRGQMYTGHLSVLRTSLVREVGGFREGFDGSQDHDLVLRVTERARRVVHIPEILYHWRVVPGSAAGDVDAKPYAWTAGRNAVQEHLDRLGIDGDVDYGASPGLYTISLRLDPARRVSVVIPTNGSSGLIWGERRVFVVDAVRSVLEHTEHDNLELVVVHDPVAQHVLDQLRELAGDKLVLVPFDEPFNFSRKMNLGVLCSTGDRLVFLNDDVQVRSDRWLEELVAPLEEPDVGLTGAKLYFSNDLIQHAGHVYEGGQYLHASIDTPRDSLGEFGMLSISREVSGVTAACSAMRRETFFDVGGFAEGLPANFNDVDLCYKVRFLGNRIIVVATCELYHFESRSRDRLVGDWERLFVHGRWGAPRVDAYSGRQRRGPNATALDVWERRRGPDHEPATT
ncbi:MAG TPA: glycosyltransferase, partial [Nocardioides sp.]|nr:glycosyltransferase [Nocardioides sp.]